LQQFLVAALFVGMNEPHDHLAQFPTRGRIHTLGTHSGARIQK
jgi:hypothetical protein